MTTLIENKLYCVEVPSDATEIYLNEFGSFIDYNSNNISRTLQLNFYANKILGEVTKDEINFPTADFLMKKIEIQKDFYNGKVIDIEDVTYYNYESKEYDIQFQSDGFRSLLQSKGIYLNKENVKWVILLRNIQQ